MSRGFPHIITHQNLLNQSEDQELTQGRVNRRKHSRTNSAIQEHVSQGYARTYCCPTRGIVLGLMGMVGIKGVVGGSEGRRGEWGD